MERILVVEDDRFFREMYSDLLREEGYVVDTASTGSEALACLAEHAYHLVVTDLVMPDLSGLDILSKVKQQDSSIEVILVTGHANIETAILALKNGARDYLVKPINHDEFRHTVARCIEQWRLINENQELKGLINLFQSTQVIGSCLDLERLYPLVVDTLSKELHHARAIGLFPDLENTTILREVRGLPQVEAEQLGRHFTDPQLFPLENAGTIVRIDEFSSSFTPPVPFQSPFRNALVLQIHSRNTYNGTVVLFDEPDKPFPEELNSNNLNFILDQSSLAFENAARYTNASNLLYIDDLTGLFNYRYLDMALERELKRAERFRATLSVVFIDLDCFKGVNDVHGHIVGSRVLREVGALLKKSVRDVDMVIRYGGDEFTLILVETGTSGAGIVAERIRSSLENHRFLADDNMDIRLTASLGYACYPDDTANRQELLDLADKAMYSGKARGKNIVVRLKLQ
jgi:diguanylate cyclase (GGDEF)-like protein